ncbi:MAG TPA: hypothetical protein VF636_01965 [Sphingomonas sp.]|jgi:hypothetical protein
MVKTVTQAGAGTPNGAARWPARRLEEPDVDGPHAPPSRDRFRILARGQGDDRHGVMQTPTRALDEAISQDRPVGRSGGILDVSESGTEERRGSM